VPAGHTTHPLDRRPVKSKCVYRKKKLSPICLFSLALVLMFYYYSRRFCHSLLLLLCMITERPLVVSYPTHFYVSKISNPLDSKGNYSAMSNNTKLVYWSLMGGLLHLVQQGGAWVGCSLAQSPPRCTKCNSPPINGQCTSLYDGPLLCGFNAAIKGLMATRYEMVAIVNPLLSLPWSCLES